MKKSLLAFSIVALLAGCSKDKFQTKPQIRLLEEGDFVVPKNESLTFKFEFTDKEGDVDDSLFIFRDRLNSRSPGPQGLKLTKYKFKIPDFPDRQKGEIDVLTNYQSLIITLDNLFVPNSGTPPQVESDSIRYKFVVRDKAGNSSDTLVVPLVVVQR